MKSMNMLLDEAERTWREEVKRDFPLRGDTKVIRSNEKNGRDWTFSTDLVNIFAHIANDEALKAKFKEVIGPLWNGDPEELARQTLHYLLYHELYHPVEAPRSINGDDNDNKSIHQAMRRGIVKAEPNLSALEQVVKVQASENGVKDLILDNRFALDNRKTRYVRDDIIPTWDVLELQKVSPKTNFYTVTRLLYGLMYGPDSTHEFFEQKAGKDGIDVASKALGALLKQEVRLPRKAKTLVDRAKSFIGRDSDDGKKEDYIPSMREVFSGNDRYTGIERLMTILGPYVEKGMPQSRPSNQGEGAGNSPQNILQDLLDDMSVAEQQQFLQQIMNAKPKDLEAAASSLDSTHSGIVDQMKHLDLLATHEFYKRNHPTVVITGGNQIGERVDIGSRYSWHLKSSRVLTQDQLAHVNLQRIDTMQRRTRLPWLIDLGNGTFRLNEFEPKERKMTDIVYRDADIDVPDAVELYVDSSGSMFDGVTGSFRPNDGSRWDMLSHVAYGFVDALRQAGQYLGKQTSLRIHNVADHQVDSEVRAVDKFWDGDSGMLKVLFQPNNGYSKEDLTIIPHNDGKRRAYVVITDGELVIPGRTAREATKMKQLAKGPRNSVLLFEIGGTYSLGNAVKADGRIKYYQVHNKNEMLQAGLEVLLSR